MIQHDSRLCEQETGDLDDLMKDPVNRLLLTGAATTVSAAEKLYLNSCMPDLVALLQSPLTDEELERHPLILMLVALGSRGWEDSIL